MEPSPPFDPAVTELGRRLVYALASEGQDDVLSKWMAHHIASLLTNAERAEAGPGRTEAQQACMEGVFKLWSHRRVLPDGSRPFEKAEAALNTLVRLDPNAADNFYFRLRRQHEEVDDGEDVKWLRSAEAIDQAARALIRFCLGQAMKRDESGLSDWVELTKSLEPPSHWDVQLVSALVDASRDSDPEKLARRNGGKALELSKQLSSLIPVLQALQKDLDGVLQDGGPPRPPE